MLERPDAGGAAAASSTSPPPSPALDPRLASVAGSPADRPGPALPGPLPDAGAVLGELAIAAAGIGTYDWDIASGRLVWDSRMRAIYGEPSGSPAERAFDDAVARIHPDDAERVRAAMEEAVTGPGELRVEYRVVLPSGDLRWVAARGRVLHDADGSPVRLLGAAYDVTERQEVELRTERVLESMPTAFFSLDRDWRFTYVNAEAEQVLGSPREALLGGVVWDLFPAAVGTEFEDAYRASMETGRPVGFDAYYPPPLDAWFEVRAWPAPDGLAVYFLDVTDRRRAQERTERAARRAALVAAVTDALTENLDAEHAVGQLASLLVPELADWCIVTLAEEEDRAGARRGLRDIGSAHRDPALAPLVERYAEHRIDALTDDAPLVRALTTGEPSVLAQDAAAQIAGVLRTASARALVERLAPESATVLPLLGRSGTVGLITLFAGAGRGPLTGDELAVAQEVAGRAGLALDNARLLQQQRRLAEGLQRALLTEPPSTPGLDIAVRYVPAGEAAQVGGDWYDAFPQRDGATVVVIGDVVGHDIVAAAAMGQLRSLLRGIAVSTGAGPAQVLAGVDHAMLTLGVATLATAVVARVHPSGEVGPGGAQQVTWSNAGHPPPLLLRADGTVSEVDDGRPDLLLGVVPETERRQDGLTLHPGDTLLLYTDGLVERRDLPLGDGIARLRRALEERAALAVDDLCDAVLSHLLTARRHDDVALVALHVPRAGRDVRRPG